MNIPLENPKVLKRSKAKSKLRSVAISTGPSTHLDHLGVLASLMDIPLIVTDVEAFKLAQEFYPQLQLIQASIGDLTLDYLASNFDVIYQCGKFWALELVPLLQLFYQKKMRFVFCPHGNSDKHSTSTLSLEHDISLVYGDQMLSTADGCLIKTGNLRLDFYQKYKTHFDALAEEKVFSHFDGSKPFLLYAPTWDTEESPTSFFKFTAPLIESLKNNYHILIKPHPLLEENHPAHYHALVSTKEALVLKDFPAIYPLLERTSVYVGDYSSIGYDFLYYDRPLFFLASHKKEKTYLQQCGRSIDSIENLKQILDRQEKDFSQIRKETYRYAFGPKADPLKVKKEIEKALSQ